MCASVHAPHRRRRRRVYVTNDFQQISTKIELFNRTVFGVCVVRVCVWRVE